MLNYSFNVKHTVSLSFVETLKAASLITTPSMRQFKFQQQKTFNET